MAKVEDLIKQLRDEADISTKVGKSIEKLAESIKDANEEMIATYVEGTKRILKSSTDPTPAIKSLERVLTTQNISTKSQADAINRAAKAMVNNPDIRTTRNEIKNLREDLKRKEFTVNFPKNATEAIPVRLSDGKKFYKAVNKMVQAQSEGANAVRGLITAGGGGKNAFKKSDGSMAYGLVDDDNHVQVDIVSGGGTGGTSATDDAAFTAGSGTGTPAMGFFSTDTVNSGDVGVFAMDASRRMLVSIEADNAGIGGGTQYTEGDTDATITGTAMMMEGATNSLVPAQGTTTDGLLVNLGSNNDVTLATLPDTAAGDLATLAGAVSGTEMQVDIVASLPAGTNAIGKLSANSGVDIGDVDVTSISAGSNLIGDVGIQGRATGGLSSYYDADLDETAVAVKASAGTIYGITAFNTTAAPLFLQLFNVAQGSVTVGTTTPTEQYVIPGNADSDGAGFTYNIPQGIAYGTAITAACSTNSEGNGAPGAGACIINIHYK